MSEFNSDALRGVAAVLDLQKLSGSAAMVRECIQRYEELQTRCTEDRAVWSAELGQKNAKIASLEAAITDVLTTLDDLGVIGA